MSAVQDWKSVVKSDYFTAAISTGIACLFTNPVEVIKTRLQLQGELSGKSVPKIYKGPFHAAYVIFKNEGILALQKGLTTAILYQVVMNGIRLGSHSSFKQLTGAIDPYSTPFFFFRNLLSGAASGALGTHANPIEKCSGWLSTSIQWCHRSFQRNHSERGYSRSLERI
eukprot:TRINITY_DN6317_c0_g2_i2.p1 TRINITY_DN6317_c0_g2~~TRINITY_DN6317_c0_g2_i2.p1  ORF type:complete len:169 (+),score=16.30 TRINITY_DN6317_c0_g2_i2:41-547(+)